MTIDSELDLSGVPFLEERQQIKELSDQIEKAREAYHKILNENEHKIDALRKAAGGESHEGRECAISGLPMLRCDDGAHWVAVGHNDSALLEVVLRNPEATRAWMAENHGKIEFEDEPEEAESA